MPQLIESYRWPISPQHEHLQQFLVKVLKAMEDFRIVMHLPQATDADKAKAFTDLRHSEQQAVDEHGSPFPTLVEAVRSRSLNVAMTLM